ncbi:MAG: hypothetical protein AAB570_00885 [Patescibacteria group bacterium]
MVKKKIPKPVDCARFRKLTHTRNEKLVEQHLEQMKEHRNGCAACLDWLIADVDQLMDRTDDEEFITELLLAREKLVQRKAELQASVREAAKPIADQLNPPAQDSVA